MKPETLECFVHLKHIQILPNTYPMVALRFSCQAIPNGRVGYDHQYQGFSIGTLGKVITLFGPQGTRHFSFKSAQKHSA